MKKTYKVVFTPAEPFFFGNEKSFLYNGQKIKSQYAGSYFMKSEEMPSQTAILGSLRYIFLVHKKYGYDEANVKTVGAQSFDMDSADEQNFGIIKKIYPVFIQGKDDSDNQVTLIPTPMDHMVKVPSEENPDEKVHTKVYTPFFKYSEPFSTIDGEKIYADDFDVKSGVAESFTSVENGKIYSKDEVYKTDLRIGINRNSKRDGLFKKEFRMLKNNFSFAVYAELDIDEYKEIAKENSIDITEPQCVFMGQSKSAFSVRFIEENNTLDDDIKNFLSRYERKYPFIYCFGDVFVGADPYAGTLFDAVATKDYRPFRTKENGSISKGEKLYRLLKSGSVIVCSNSAEWTKGNSNPKAEMIGFNNFIVIGG